MKKNKIESVRIERVVDENPITDWMGKYTNEPTDWAICSHCGQYVALAEAPNRRAAEIENEIIDLENEVELSEDAITVNANNEMIDTLHKERAGLVLHDCPRSSCEYNYFLPYAGGEEQGTDNYQSSGMQDYKRMEGLNDGDWYFMGIIAKAEIITENGTMQTIRSGGLWGVESDGGSYLDEVAQEQLSELRNELTSLGFGKRAIDYAFKNIETVDN